MADRYTTPTLHLTVEGADLTGCKVVVTLSQGRAKLDFTESDFDSIDIDPEGMTADIDVTLTQQQSAMFKAGKKVEVQVNFVDPNGFRSDTEIAELTLGRNLHERVMRNG